MSGKPDTVKRPLRPSQVPLVVLSLLSMALIAWAIANWVRNGALQDELRTGEQQLQLYAAYIEGELARYEAIPALLATNQRVFKVLQQPENYSARQALNEYLEQSALATGALDVYLMNQQGLTVAASNWQTEGTFLGRNFGFRPYFQQAMRGELGRYYALGTTSHVRGYYFAYPVTILGQVRGAVVVKMDVSATEINAAMKMACVRAIAGLARKQAPDNVRAAYGGQTLQFGPDYLIPKPFDRRLMEAVPLAVARAAIETGAARLPRDLDAYAAELSDRVFRTSLTLRPVFDLARVDRQRVVFAEGETDKVIQAAQQVVEQQVARPLLVGRRERIVEKIRAFGLSMRLGQDIDIVDPSDDQWALGI